jgi:hypothetical protein
MRMRSGAHHYSDPDLLAYADGALSARAGSRIQQHLLDCWECRGRLTELERQAHDAARQLAESGVPPADRIAFAKQRLQQRMTLIEDALAQQGTAEPWRPLRGWWFRILAPAAAAACLIWAVVMLRDRPAQRPALDARSVLRSVEAGEAAQFATGTARHEKLRLRVRYSGPRQRTSSSVVEAWSDPRQKRFAVTLTADGGDVQAGDWHNGDRGLSLRDGYVRAVSSSSGCGNLGMAECLANGFRSERLERAYLDWLAAQQWRPVAWSRELSRFAGADGTSLTVERIANGNGRSYRLRARRQDQSVTSEILFDVDDGMRPRVQRIRFGSGNAAAEFELTLISRESVDAARLSPAVFEPPLPEQSRQLNATPRLPDPPVPADGLPTLTDDTLLQVHYLLHRNGSCVRDRIEAGRGSDGRLRLRGFIDSAERGQALLSALAGLPGVGGDIELLVAPAEAPAEAAGVRRSGDLIFYEGLALAKLAEAYPDDRVARLSHDSVRLLELMVRQHNERLRVLAADLSTVIAPAAPPLSGTASDATWQERCFALFRAASQLDDLLEQYEGDKAATAATARDAGSLVGFLNLRTRDMAAFTAGHFTDSTRP